MICDKCGKEVGILHGTIAGKLWLCNDCSEKKKQLKQREKVKFT